MQNNDVWDLVNLPDDFKLIDCKWVSQTKRDSRIKLKAFKPDWLLKVSLKVKKLILMQRFSQSQVKIRPRLLWHLFLLSI